MSTRGREAVLSATLLVSLTVIYSVSMATYNVTNDAQTAALSGWRIAQTGHPWFDGYNYEQWTAGPFPIWVYEAPNGHLAGYRAPGVILAAVPLFAAMRIIGVDEYVIAAGSFTGVMLAVATIALLYRTLRATSRAVALPAVLIVGLATPVWSVAADGLYAHGVTMLGIAGMAWACVRERWLLVGLFGGVAVLGRLHTAVIVAVLGVGLAMMRRQSSIAVKVGLASGSAVVLAVGWSHWVYGTLSPAGGYSVHEYVSTAGQPSDWLAPLVNHAGMWISPDRGILVWTPVILLLLPALLRRWPDLPDWSRALAVGGVVYTLIQGQINGFTGGSGLYGYRLGLELLICVVPAIALSLECMGRWARRLLGPVVGLQFAMISLGAAGEGGMLPEDDVWTTNSFVHALATVPMLIVWPVIWLLVGWRVGRALDPGRPARSQALPDSEVCARDDLDHV